MVFQNLNKFLHLQSSYRSLLFRFFLQRYNLWIHPLLCCRYSSLIKALTLHCTSPLYFTIYIAYPSFIHLICWHTSTQAIKCLSPTLKKSVLTEKHFYNLISVSYREYMPLKQDKHSICTTNNNGSSITKQKYLPNHQTNGSFRLIQSGAMKSN